MLIVGSVAVDTIRTPNGSASDTLGGSATFAALAAKHFGEILLLSAIGPDFPQSLLKDLEAAQVPLNNLTRTKDGKTFRWEGVYDEGLGSRTTIGLDLGVMATAKLNIPAKALECRYAMMATYHPTREMEVLGHLKRGTFVATDTIFAWIEYEKEALTELYRHTNLICLDGHELKLFTKIDDEAIAVKHLLSLGAEYVIVKYGKRGSRLYSKEGRTQFVGIYPNSPVETTGAGDTYLGAIMAYLNRKGQHTFEDVIEGMVWGSATASITTEAFGVNALIKTSFAEISRRFQGVVREEVT